MVLIGGAYYYPIFAVRVVQHVFITLILGVWLALRLARKRGLPQTPLNLPLYACALIWFASALLSPEPRMAFENLWIPLTNLLLFFVMADLLQSGRESLLVETQFLLAALVVILASVQLGSWFFGWGFATPSVGWIDVLSPETPFPLTSPRLYVPLGVSTWLAAYTAPLALFALAWGQAARRRAVHNVFWLLALLLVGITLLTNSRGGWISLSAATAIFILLRLLGNPRAQQIVRRYIMPIGAAVLVVAAAGIAALVIIGADPGHASGDVLRFDLWRGSIEITRQHPFLGTGPGLFGHAYRLIRDPLYVDNRLGTAHNFYLNTLAETGIIGALVALTLAAVLLRTWWALWRSAQTPARRLHLEGALAALIGLGAQSFFDTFTSVPLVLLALGLAAYCVTEIRSRTAPPLKSSRTTALISLILLILFGAGLLRSDQAQAAFNASVSTGSLDQARQAAALDPSLDLYHLQVAYLTDGDPAQSVDIYQEALALEPTWDTGWINLAAFYQRQGETTLALDALQRAIDVDNRNGALLLWAQLAESADTAPSDIISDAYTRYLDTTLLDPGKLPLSSFWDQTELRKQALEDYARKLSPDLHYRITAEHAPGDLSALVPAAPSIAADWWIVGEYALTVEGDADKAAAAFTEAIASSVDSIYRGDYYASRARARFTRDIAGAQRDLAAAELLGTYNEYPNAIRAQMVAALDEQRRLWAAAVPPRVIDQNFEGVLFAGRVASFDLLPEMRLPGPGHSVMQPWYDLAASYEMTGQTADAINVWRAILDRAPEEQQARDQLDRLTGNAS